MDPQPAHGHRLRYLCTRTRAHLQPRHLQFSSCRGFRSRPQRMSTNSVAGGVRPEPAGSSAWDDLSAQGSSVAIGSSDSIAQGKDCSCKPPAFPPLHMDVQVPQSTWQGLLLQSSCIPAIHGGQMCESGHRSNHKSPTAQQQPNTSPTHPFAPLILLSSTRFPFCSAEAGKSEVPIVV